MTYTRAAGTTTPTYAGYCTFNSLPINDGTFRSSDLGMITGGPPSRGDLSSLPDDDGGLIGDPFIDFWQFDIAGFFDVPTIADIWPAITDLRTQFNAQAGFGQLTFKALGWSAARYLTARVVGVPVITEPDLLRKKLKRREFRITMEAADPLSYNADSAFSVDIGVGASGNVVNNGNYKTPITVTFVGPLTSPELNAPGSGNKIKLKNPDGTDYAIASGHSVVVTLNPATSVGVTAILDGTTDVYDKVANMPAAARTAAPGTHSWSLAAAAGSGHVTVALRDAWLGN